MTFSLDLFLTALYTFLDELVKDLLPPSPYTHPSQLPSCSDSELLSLFLLHHFFSSLSERDFLLYARRHLLSFFPRLPSQSSFNRRGRRLALASLSFLPSLFRRLSSFISPSSPPPASFHILDGFSIKLMSLPRGRRTSLFPNFANVGFDATQDNFFYGIKIMLAIDTNGLPSGLVMGPANTDERALAETLLAERKNPCSAPPSARSLDKLLGPIHKKGGKRKAMGTLHNEGAGEYKESYLVDNGITGEKWEEHWREDYGNKVLHTKLFKGKEGSINRYRAKQISRERQKVENVYGWAEKEVGLKKIRAKTEEGVIIKVVAKIMGCAIGIAINQVCGRKRYQQMKLLTLI